MSDSFNSDQIYNEFYYRHDCGQPYERSPEWLGFFGGIADKIVQRINPASVLDAGCAMGFLVESLRDRGVDAYGVDISEYAIQKVRDDVKPYCQVGSLLNAIPRRYGLIVCIEVLEHLQPATAEKAIKHLCDASDDILFSSSPMDYYEATHFNVQPPEYWAELFALNGFTRDVDFDASFITPWAFRFRKNTDTFHELVRNYERKFSLLWKENQDARKLAVDIRDRIAFLESSLEVSKRNLIEKSDELLDARLQIVAMQQELNEKEQEVQSIYASRAWRITHFLLRFRQILLPVGSMREEFVRKSIHGFRFLGRVLWKLISLPQSFVRKIIKGIQHARLNGVKSFFKRAGKEFRRSSPKKTLGLSMQKNVIDISLTPETEQALLLTPLTGFFVPHSNRRVNLILDTLDENSITSLSATAIPLAALLAEKWQCDMRIITRLGVAKKSSVSTILKRVGITASNIEFVFVQAGNSKMSLPVGMEEDFVVTSWTSVKSLQANFDLNKVIYLLQGDEGENCVSQEDKSMYMDILTSAPVKFIVSAKAAYEQFVAEGLVNIRDHAVWLEMPEALDSWRPKLQQVVDQIDK